MACKLMCISLSLEPSCLVLGLAWSYRAMAPRYDELPAGWECCRKLCRRVLKTREFVLFPKTEKEGQHPTSTTALELNADALCVMVEKLRIPAKRVPVKCLEDAVPC